MIFGCARGITRQMATAANEVPILTSTAPQIPMIKMFLQENKVISFWSAVLFIFNMGSN